MFQVFFAHCVECYRNWWRKQQLKSKFLEERREIAFHDCYAELEEDFDVAMDKLKQKYLCLGLTQSEMDKLCHDHPSIVVSG
jgi:hypothetical protein